MSLRYKGGVISATAPTTSSTSAPGIWTLEAQLQAKSGGNWPTFGAIGQQAYTTAGTYSWIAPAGITSVCVVCVGAGGSSPNGVVYNGGGGGLGWKNNISVTPGNSYTVVVGAGGTMASPDGGDSYFSLSTLVKGSGGTGAAGTGGLGGGYVGDGGGNGGTSTNGYYAAGGGAGGYAGNGGNGAISLGYGSNGAGGGGGGGGRGTDSFFGNYVELAAGGGVGILGQGSNGAGGAGGAYTAQGGGGGSGGATGGSATGGGSAPNGGAYGGGSGTDYNASTGAATRGTGGGGAVRIIWAGGSGITRAFPSTNTGDL